MKKKTVLVVLSVVFVILLISLSLLYTRFASGTDKYASLMKLCLSSQDAGVTTTSCKGFIRRVSEEDPANPCFDLLLITGDGEYEEHTMCAKDSIIEWDNPYDDYTSLIPVNIDVSYKQFLSLDILFGESIKISLLDDEETVAFLDSDNIVEDNSSLFASIRIQENEAITDKGYYMTGKSGSGVSDNLVFMQVAIREILIDGSDMTFHLVSTVDGQRVMFEVNTEGFEYMHSVDYEQVITDITVLNTSVLDIEETYDVVFVINPNTFELEEFIELMLSTDKEDVFVMEGLELVVMMANF
ncbi:hypothetical protein K8R20_01375 [bacterium]|nr:hypothetical protein [bacterium]